jgi:hypothetical protein
MSERTRTEIKERINSLIVDNETWQITPQNVRDVLTDIADSYTQPNDETKEITVLSANITSADGLKVEGVKVVGTQQATISDADETPTLNAVYSHTEVETAIGAQAETINSILEALRTHGLIATINP